MAATTTHPQLTARFTEGIAYARMLHRDQVRKGTGGTPYLAHLISTAALVLEDGGDEDDAIAALLHDALEDQAERTSREHVEEIFGSHVASIVVECSDREPGEDLRWRERKERYIRSLAKKSTCARRVSNADKLHNARSIVRDLYQHGDEAWGRFSQPREEQLWYYKSLAVAFFDHNRGPLADALVRTVQEMLGIGQSLAPADPGDEIERFVESWRHDLEEQDRIAEGT